MDEIDIALGFVPKDLQLAFNFECEVAIENKKSTNSKPMSGEEYKQKIARAYERYIKRRELQYATDSNKG